MKEVHTMDSCFPPLAALSLRDSDKNNKPRHGQQNVFNIGLPTNANTGKIEILQDLDLYYIRQIAHNLKVLTLILVLFSKLQAISNSKQ